MTKVTEKQQPTKTQPPERVPAEPTAEADPLHSFATAASSADLPIDPKSFTPSMILSLQRTVGNQVVQRLMAKASSSTAKPAVQPKADDAQQDDDEEEFKSTAPASIVPLTAASMERITGVKHPIAEALQRPGIRFRVPEFDQLKATYLDKNLSIPPDVIKNRLAQLLGRMRADNPSRVKSTEDIPTIVAKIFPAPGMVNEAEFENAVDTSNRERVYKDANQAVTKLKAEDVAKLKPLIKEALDLIQSAQANQLELEQVFGSKAPDAQANYANAYKILENAGNHIDTAFTTDYNMDADETATGGWADADRNQIHLLLSNAQGTDPRKSKATLVHEASHLANPSVDDKGYYATDGFEAMTEDEKVTNAAHYEELPRRIMGSSFYMGQTFKPGSAGGKPVTDEARVRRITSEYVRNAWASAINIHAFIRAVRLAQEKGDPKLFMDNKPLIMEMSPLMDLTIHTQTPGKEQITTLDLTLTESIAHATNALKTTVRKAPFPTPIVRIPLIATDEQLRDLLLAQGIADYGQLLGNAARDKILIDWLVNNADRIPGV